MEEYKVSTVNGLTIIEQPAQSFKVSVEKDRCLSFDTNTAILEATLYKEEGVFVKDCSYIFEALDKTNQPITGVIDIDAFKGTVDFFFTSLLNTEHYIQSVPKCSALCTGDIKLFNY